MANYINLMRQKENECAAYLAKAEQELLSRVDSQDDEETIAQIQDGRLCITRELFETAFGKCVITEKADKEQEEREMSLHHPEED